jgi:hypothetical protein
MYLGELKQCGNLSLSAADTIDMCVLYWPDGTWCYKSDYYELGYTHMSDDIGHLTVSMMLDYEQVDALVRMACIKRGGINVSSRT